MGDDGLNGKKFVIDHYGPQVPTGGGAICGKDVRVPDLTLARTARDLELAAVDWPAVMRRGYFGTGERWER
jgi:S-adenosylmethionine synthetase